MTSMKVKELWKPSESKVSGPGKRSGSDPKGSGSMDPMDPALDPPLDDDGVKAFSREHKPCLHEALNPGRNPG